MGKRYYCAEDIAELCYVSIPTAYRFIKKWNEELKEMGFHTISGKIVKDYADLRLGIGVDFKNIFRNASKIN